MSSDRINDALFRLLDAPLTTEGTVFVCHATEDEWNEFAVSEDPEPALKTHLLDWFETTGEIHMIELLPNVAHETLRFALHSQFNTDANASLWLRCRGASCDSRGRAIRPDLHFGPTSRTPGAVNPRVGMEWSDFNTIKIEFGVTQSWGDEPGQLDHKAVVVWSTVPGVEYVLCIKTDQQLTSAEFKLYDFREPLVVQPTATPIVQGTTTAFDAHHVLGVPVARSLPAGLPDPFVVDFYTAVEEARRSV